MGEHAPHEFFVEKFAERFAQSGEAIAVIRLGRVEGAGALGIEEAAPGGKYYRAIITSGPVSRYLAAVRGDGRVHLGLGKLRLGDIGGVIEQPLVDFFMIHGSRLREIPLHQRIIHDHHAGRGNARHFFGLCFCQKGRIPERRFDREGLRNGEQEEEDPAHLLDSAQPVADLGKSRRAGDRPRLSRHQRQPFLYFIQ